MIKQKKKNKSEQNAFTLLELMIGLGLASIIFLAYSKSTASNLYARKEARAKLAFNDISPTMRSMLRAVLINPPAVGCLNFSQLKQMTQAASVMHIDNQVASALSDRNLKILQQDNNQFASQAVERCSHEKDRVNPSDPADNKAYFCATFQRQEAGSQGGFLSSPHAFAEFRAEFIDGHTGQALSCDDFRLAQQAGVNIYYGLYWLNERGNESGYAKHVGSFYVGK